MVAQAAGAIAITKTLLGTSGHMTRISPNLPHCLSAMDEPAFLDDLIGLGDTEAVHRATEVIDRFFDVPAAPMSIGKLSLE